MKKETKTIPIAEVIPYDRNPRKNDIAVDDVAESIRQCGYIAPIIVDEDTVVLCGHTRLKALKKLGWKECEVTVVTGMTEEQKKKYRLLDNKVAEKATWDFELLDWELSELDFEGFDFGFSLIDKEETEQQNTVKEPPEFNYKEQYGVIVMCKDEKEQEAVYNELTGSGYECKVVAT